MSNVLVLHRCSASMTSHGGFKWPSSGPVEAPDWDGGQKVCGGKLHGFPWGEGDGSLVIWNGDARWLVVSVPASEVIDLVGKVGFRSGTVVFCGDRAEATDYLLANGALGKAVMGATVSAGDHETSTSGYRGTSNSGDHGTSNSGDRGTSNSGDHGLSVTGDHGTSNSGDHGLSVSGEGGTSNSGDRGISISGDHGLSVSGDHGKSISGDGGTAISGIRGEIRIYWHDGTRYRTAVGHVGEGGIEPNKHYVVRGGQLVKAH